MSRTAKLALLTLIACTPDPGVTDTDTSTTSDTDPTTSTTSTTTTTGTTTTGTTTTDGETTAPTTTVTATDVTATDATVTDTDATVTDTDATDTTDTDATDTDATDTDVFPSCDDGVQNEDETDIDCGGAICVPCIDGQACLVDEDCFSQICDAELCLAPACDDGKTNGDESDLDCGGSCDPCVLGQQCEFDGDCASDTCENNVCVDEGCSDGVQNGDETDIDCGGSCLGCEESQQCSFAEDCISLVCTDNLCAAATCDDGVKNGQETEVDCGGPTCAPCMLENLIINEVDYDQIGSDLAEYIEIYNNTGAPVDLVGKRVLLVNGGVNPPAVYNSIDLAPAGTLAQGQYLVIAAAALQVPPEAKKINFALVQDNIQNGAPDGIALVDTVALKILDALSYEGALTMVPVPGLGNVSLVEGEAFTEADSNTEDASLSRIPNGNDKNNAKTDWAYSKKLTPGAPNQI
jgi:hypothetical protein